MAAATGKERQSVGKNFVAGAIGGATSTVLFQPFDVVKTHIQGSQASTPPRVRDVVRFIVSRQGVLGLWSGTTPAFLRVGFGAGLYFSLLGPVISFLSTGTFTASSSAESLRNNLPSSVMLGAGAVTRSVAAFVVCPITVVKTRMEYEAASGLRYPNIVKAIAIISRTEGFKGLYSGFLPTILRDAPYSGLYLLFYSSARRTLAGAMAGATATVLTHPPDVVTPACMIRTRLQLQSSDEFNIFSAARSIFKMHGIRGFFAGVLPRAGRRAVHQAFSWAIYEEIIQILTQVTH